MNLSLCTFICSISYLTLVLAGENASLKKDYAKNHMKDDSTIDDEDTEGSGFGESRYDLESSGSGYGPDDEDAEHGSGPLVNINSKSGQVRGNEQMIPLPSSTITSVSSSLPPLPKHISESTPRHDDKSKAKPAEIVPKENKNIGNNNVNRGETEAENSGEIPEKTIEEEIDFDSHHPEHKNDEDNKSDSSGVYKVNTPDRDRATSFFAQPGILAAVIGGAVVGLLCAILVVMFIVYRMRKKDEGSYPLEEMKRCPTNNPYMKPNHREFFA